MSIETEIQRAIAEGCNIEIKYQKYDGEMSVRELSGLSYNNDYGEYGYKNDHIKGYCNLRNEERTFRISRIIAVKVLPFGSWITNHSSANGSVAGNSMSKTIVHSYSGEANNYSVYKPSGNNYRSSTSSKEGCYIATMVYGSYSHPKVMVLRWYRDNVMQKSCIGRLFIRTYYYFSPKLVVVLKGHKTVNSFIRCCLDKVVIWCRERNGSV